MSEKDKHWLYRKENLPKLWIALIVLLVVSLLPEFFIHHHPHFGDGMTRIDVSWGFFAWYGFVTCAAMVVGAKLLGIFLKRKDTYYDE
ncbi:MAG: hypothetical protein R3F02_14075 [Thiolinea sp.]